MFNKTQTIIITSIMDEHSDYDWNADYDGDGLQFNNGDEAVLFKTIADFKKFKIEEKIIDHLKMYSEQTDALSERQKLIINGLMLCYTNYGKGYNDITGESNGLFFHNGSNRVVFETLADFKKFKIEEEVYKQLEGKTDYTTEEEIIDFMCN